MSFAPRLQEFTMVWYIVALCSIANFINAADRVIMPIAIIPLADQFKWDLHQQGWILSAFSVGYLSSMVLGGSAAKKFGGKYTLSLAVLLWSLSSLITPFFASSMSALVILRFLLGVGEGIGLPTIFHIFAHVIPVEDRGRAFGYLLAFGSIGQTAAALICPHLHWSAAFYIFGMVGIVWVGVWLLVYRALSILEIRSCEELSQHSKLVSHQVHWFEFFSYWSLWAIYVAHFCMNWTSYIVMQWLPTYLVRYLGAGKHEVMFTALPYLSNSFASIAAGHLADNLVRRQWSVLAVRRLMTGIGLLGPGLLLLAFSASNSVAIAVFLISISMGLSACNSAGHLSGHVEVAPNHAGITFAISNTLATIPGILCGPLTAELVVQSSGRWFPVFVIAGFVNLAGAVVYVSQAGAVPVL